MTIVYSKPNCPNCDRTKRLLDKHNIPFKVVDLSTDAEALAKVKAAGFMAAPVVTTDDGDAWSGFRPDKILSLRQK